MQYDGFLLRFSLHVCGKVLFIILLKFYDAIVSLLKVALGKTTLVLNHKPSKAAGKRH